MIFGHWLRRMALGAVIAITGPFSVAWAQNDLKIYNWSEHINPAVLDAFTRETGIRVIYDPYDQPEQALAGLKAGYDLVAVSAPVLTSAVALKLLSPLEKIRISNLIHVSPELSNRLAKHDPSNRHAAIYAWGTIGLGFNLKKIRERLGPEARVESWAVLFNPETLKKLAPCGVHVLDSAEEMFAAALRHLGLDPDSKREADWRRASDLLMKIRPHVQKFSSSEFVGALANGDICLVAGSSGDVQQARRRAAEARNGIEIGYAIPKEGASLWIDSLVIPANAPRKDAAHLFLDFIHRPEVAALNAGHILGASGNMAAREHLPAHLGSDQAIYPPAEVLRRLYTLTPSDESARRALNRLWLRVKSGK